MEDMIWGFITWQFVFFCLALGAIVYVVRRIAEFIMQATQKEAKWWREFVLPIFPIILGQTVALLIVSYPYPEGFTSAGGRWIFGLVAGFSSGFVVRMYKSLLSTKVAELVAKLKSLLGSVKKESKEELKEDQQ